MTLMMTFSFADTLRRVAMQTAYQAVKSDTAGTLYDRVAVVEADAGLLRPMWRESMASVEQAVAAYVRGAAGQHGCDDVLRLVLHLPSNFHPSAPDIVRRYADAFVAYDLEARWLSVSLPEKASGARAMADQSMAGLKSALDMRRRKPCPPELPQK